jgi:nitroreductase
MESFWEKSQSKEQGRYFQEKNRMALTALEVDHLKQAPAVEGVLPAILHRWSGRAFADREVSSEVLEKLFEAARWAASAFNEQPWRFLVGTQGTATYEKILATLSGFNREWAGNAPVLILGVASSRFAHNGKENTYALYDLGAAAAALTLQADSMGLRTHTMAGFDHDAARVAFEIPAEFHLGAVIAAGYQGDPSQLTQERLLELETSPRTRKPLHEIMFSPPHHLRWG